MAVPLLIAMAAVVNCAYAKEMSIDVTLKNLYADRDFDDATKPSVGSWSQGIIARAKGEHELTQDLALTFTGSVQYAQRLSNDKHLNDMILPFDPVTKEQASNYNKIAGSIGAKYKQHQLSWGEQWVDTPLATTDYSRQLITIYQGLLYSGQLNEQLKLDVGYLDKYSPRNEEEFRKLSVNKKESDGLTYIDLKHKAFDRKLQTQIFVSELEDLYNQYSIGLDYKNSIDQFRLNTKFRYYYTEETGDELLGYIDNQYFGLMQEFGYGPNTIGLGLQKIQGESNFPMLDGAVPVLSYVNWTQGTFNKANELSYHFTFNHDASWLVPGLNLLARYVDGQNYAINGQKGYDESEFDFIANYRITEGKLKGLGFQWLNLNYKNDIQGDYTENRFFTTYSFKF
ncbi:OprD family outer membrane porin [Acinetobacter radioresistens]|uniref:OprD family outer membrane porin n=1 Tax=Acinetobacter radioresistens TaxID=40216 RepID=UPI0006193BE6|nr:OprD family outer membrane porin [Acinetobacter radioresistens]